MAYCLVLVLFGAVEGDIVVCGTMDAEVSDHTVAV